MKKSVGEAHSRVTDGGTVVPNKKEDIQRAKTNGPNDTRFKSKFSVKVRSGVDSENIASVRCRSPPVSSRFGKLGTEETINGRTFTKTRTPPTSSDSVDTTLKTSKSLDALRKENSGSRQPESSIDNGIEAPKPVVDQDRWRELQSTIGSKPFTHIRTGSQSHPNLFSRPVVAKPTVLVSKPTVTRSPASLAPKTTVKKSPVDVLSSTPTLTKSPASSKSIDLGKCIVSSKSMDLGKSNVSLGNQTQLKSMDLGKSNVSLDKQAQSKSSRLSKSSKTSSRRGASLEELKRGNNVPMNLPKSPFDSGRSGSLDVVVEVKDIEDKVIVPVPAPIHAPVVARTKTKEKTPKQRDSNALVAKILALVLAVGVAVILLFIFVFKT